MTTYEYAASYVAQHYDDRLESDLTAADATAYNELVEMETRRLHGILVDAQDAWAMDADIFEPNEQRTDMTYADSITTVEAWLSAHLLSDEQREAGYIARIHDYLDRDATKLAERPWVGVRVAEVSLVLPGRGGASYMQDPGGLPICAQVERCILAHVEDWPTEEVANEFWLLGELLKEQES